MNVPTSWLKELLPGLSAKLAGLSKGEGGSAGEIVKLVEVLDGIGLSVEQVLEQPAAPEGVVVAQVARVEPVAGSAHLLRAEVTDGTRAYGVVTGAPNTKAGMMTALAKPGAVLAGGVTVAERELAGVRSEGVLCSPKELGLFDYGGGLVEFAEDVRPGQPLDELWPAETVVELELTPNRADAFSILGVTRDLSAKLGLPYRHPAHGLDYGDETLQTGLRVELRDRACPRFTLRLIEGVTVGPSPLWLQRRLAAVGSRPRNNVVDVTNYVTFELGQPSHAYDRAGLHDGAIVVRRALAGERLTALDEEDYAFSPADLLITTPSPVGGEVPIGVAGVIGGLQGSVKESTRAVALEVAHFDPVTVRKTAKRLGLSTEASYRFERGVDPNLPPIAAARAAGLIADLAGGRLHPGLTGVGGDMGARSVRFRPSRVMSLMAIEVPPGEQRGYLEALGCTVEALADDLWRVAVPSWRFDLAIEEDLVEEVSRLHGYDSIPITIPAMRFVPAGDDVTHRGLRALLVGLGFQECIGYAFLGDETLAKARAPQAAVRLAAPPSAERSALRTALYPGLLAAARTNRALSSLALFEIGRVFEASAETERLGLLLRGDWVSGGWLPGQKADFFVLKGLLQKLAGTLGAGLEVEPETLPHLHPGIGAAVSWNGREVGWLGKLHPQVAAHWELGDIFVAELALPLAAATVVFKDYGRQPHAERDLAVLAPVQVTYAELRDLVTASAGALLDSLEPFDVYEGKPIAAGRRSVALRLRFRHPERALHDDEVDAYMSGVVAAVKRAGYTVREG